MFSGCVGTRYLKKDEFLLYDQEIRGAEKVSEDELSDFYRQEPNRQFPLIPFAPYVWIYQIGLRNYDKEALQQEKKDIAEKYNRKIAKNEGKKVKVKRLQEKKEKKVSKIERSLEEGNLFMRWGEPLAIYDSSLAETTRTQMESFLQTKGYFNGQVSHSTKINSKKVTSIYTIVEHKPYVIDTIIYTTPSQQIADLIKANPKQRELKIGQIYDQNDISKERDRIDEVLKNNGYYDFSKQYVSIQVDSTIGEHEVYVNVKVNEPVTGQQHKQYRLDSIIFTTDADIRGTQDRKRQSAEYDGVTYRYYDYEYYKKILNRRVFIRPDSLYSRKQSLLTQQQLSNLDIFRFININYDTTGGEFIARIYASPLKKYQMSNEAGLNVSQGFPGPFINSSLKVRNVFGGLEILELSGRASIEGVPAYTEAQSQGTNLKSREVGASLGLTFPQFILPLPERWQSSLAKLNPRTTVQTSYNYVNRPEFNRTNFKNTFFYNWQKGNTYQYNFTPVDVNFINSVIKLDTFNNYLNAVEKQGLPLKNSFLPSFVTSTSFTSIFSFNDYGSYGIETDNNRPATYLKMFLELGGHSLSLLGLDKDTTIFGGLQYYKFAKFNPDFRQYFRLSRNSTLAYRVNMGVAIPYGRNKALPYEKYFSAGGSNSIRAWRPRRLGPGALRTDSTDVDENGYPKYSIEQLGQILLETSIEYRQKLFGFVNGAVFVDAGNIWRYVNVPGQSAGTFKFNQFYNQIAIGSGAGLRFDFSFLILRFDYGVKIYDPARDTGQRWIGQQFTVGEEIKNGVFNIGIGYPF